MKRHVMVDIETMGVNPDSVILSIGAVQFDPAFGSMGEEFSVEIDFEDACKYGTISPSTVKWWMGKGDKARFAAMNGNKPLAVGLQLFSQYLQTLGDCLLWGNGADFDNVILTSAYRNLGLVQPWGVYNNRCFRTFKNLVLRPVPVVDGQPMPERQGTHHKALDDAKYQASMMNWMARRYDVSVK